MTGIERLRAQVDGGSSPNVVLPRPMLRDIARQIEAESSIRQQRLVGRAMSEWAMCLCTVFGAAMATLVACYALVEAVIHAGWAGVAALAALSALLLFLGMGGRGR